MISHPSNEFSAPRLPDNGDTSADLRTRQTLPEAFGSRRSWWLRLVTVFVASVIAAGVALAFRHDLPAVTAFHPMTGVALVALWWCGWTFWPVVVFGLLLTAGILQTPWPALPFVVLGEFGATLLAVRVLRRITAGRSPLGKLRSAVAWLLISVIVSSVVGTLPGTLAMRALDPAYARHFAETLLVRSGSAALGVLLIAPILWAWLPWQPLRLVRRRQLEVGIFAALALVVGQWNLYRPEARWHWPIPEAALWTPLFAWAVVRFGCRGTTLLNFLVGVVTLAGELWLPALKVATNAETMSGPLLSQMGNDLIAFSTVLLTSVWLAEHQQGDFALTTAEVRYRILFENSPDAVFVVAGSHETLREFNDRLPELLGYSRQQLSQMCRTDFELGIPTLSMRSSVVSVYSPKTSEFEARYRRVDGTIIDVSVTYSVIDYFGEAAYLMIARDVTARRRAEQQLRESEARFRTLADTIPLLVAIQRDNQTLYVNPATVQLSGYADAELLQTDLVRLLRPEFQAEARRQAELVVRGERKTWRQELALLTKSGEERWMDWTVAPITLDGRLAWLVSAVDVTERRRTESEMRQLNAQLFHAGRLRLLGELAAGIAHRVKHPIGNIGNLSQALINDMDRGRETFHEELRETLVMILEEADEANHTVSEMIDFARRHEMDRSWIDLAPLVLDAARIVRFDQRWANVAIEIDTGSARPRAFADRSEITQVLIDLFRNGLEAMEETPPERRRLVVELRRQRAGWLQVSVTDCGCGVLPERRPKLFRPFETTKPEGLGLGLSLCKTIIENHGGRLWYEPVTPNGSRFHFLLPSEERVFESSDPRHAPLEA